MKSSQYYITSLAFCQLKTFREINFCGIFSTKLTNFGIVPRNPSPNDEPRPVVPAVSIFSLWRSKTEEMSWGPEKKAKNVKSCEIHEKLSWNRYLTWNLRRFDFFFDDGCWYFWVCWSASLRCWHIWMLKNEKLREITKIFYVKSRFGKFIPFLCTWFLALATTYQSGRKPKFHTYLKN